MGSVYMPQSGSPALLDYFNNSLIVLCNDHFHLGWGWVSGRGRGSGVEARRSRLPPEHVHDVLPECFESEALRSEREIESDDLGFGGRVRHNTLFLAECADWCVGVGAYAGQGCTARDDAVRNVSSKASVDAHQQFAGVGCVSNECLQA